MPASRPDQAPPFRERVYAMVRRIPRGRVASYGDVAALVGAPRAARGVGAALSALDPDDDVPWWRVINHQGRLTISPVHGLRVLQRTLLEQEGVRFRSDDAVDLDRHAWEGPWGDTGQDP